MAGLVLRAATGRGGGELSFLLPVLIVVGCLGIVMRQVVRRRGTQS